MIIIIIIIIVIIIILAWLYDMQVTTDLHGCCTEEFDGTSASAALAAGIYAVVLQAKYVAQMCQKLSVCRVSLHWYVTFGVRDELISLQRVVCLFKCLTVKRFLEIPCHFLLGKTTCDLDFTSYGISSFNAEFSCLCLIMSVIGCCT